MTSSQVSRSSSTLLTEIQGQIHSEYENIVLRRLSPHHDLHLPQPTSVKLAEGPSKCNVCGLTHILDTYRTFPAFYHHPPIFWDFSMQKRVRSIQESWRRSKLIGRRPSFVTLRPAIKRRGTLGRVLNSTRLRDCRRCPRASRPPV